MTLCTPLVKRDLQALAIGIIYIYKLFVSSWFNLKQVHFKNIFVLK